MQHCISDSVERTHTLKHLFEGASVAQLVSELTQGNDPGVSYQFSFCVILLMQDSIIQQIKLRIMFSFVTINNCKCHEIKFLEL